MLSSDDRVVRSRHRQADKRRSCCSASTVGSRRVTDRQAVRSGVASGGADEAAGGGRRRPSKLNDGIAGQTVATLGRWRQIGGDGGCASRQRWWLPLNFSPRIWIEGDGGDGSGATPTQKSGLVSTTSAMWWWRYILPRGKFFLLLEEPSSPRILFSKFNNNNSTPL